LHVEADAFKITVQEEPIRAQIDVPVQEQMIVELYSK
jgi:ribosomal protein S4